LYFRDNTIIRVESRFCLGLQHRPAHTGKLTVVDGDKKLKNAVPTLGGKNWKAIAALVPGRTKISIARDGRMMRENEGAYSEESFCS
jgi:hypothetical protein